jgi:hypothetical protein
MNKEEPTATLESKDKAHVLSYSIKSKNKKTLVNSQIKIMSQKP